MSEKCYVYIFRAWLLATTFSDYKRLLVANSLVLDAVI